MNAKLWSDLFHLGLPVLEKILRPIIIYFFLVIAWRLAGKRELAQLNPFDLVVLLTLSNTMQNAITVGYLLRFGYSGSAFHRWYNVTYCNHPWAGCFFGGVK